MVLVRPSLGCTPVLRSSEAEPGQHLSYTRYAAAEEKMAAAPLQPKHRPNMRRNLLRSCWECFSDVPYGARKGGTPYRNGYAGYGSTRSQVLGARLSCTATPGALFSAVLSVLLSRARQEVNWQHIMLAAGRYFPAATAARRTATVRSSSSTTIGFVSKSAPRRSSACIRTLSTEGTPGTVAGARAAASAGGYTGCMFVFVDLQG